MNDKIVKIITPKTGVNDDFLILVNLFFNNSDFINEGEEIASLESSKQATTIDASNEGYFYAFFEEGDDVPVGSLFGVISKEKIENIDELKKLVMLNDDTHKDENEKEVQLTKRAQFIFDESDLTFDDLPKGKILREKDVLDIISEKNNALNQHNLDIESIKENINPNSIIICGGGGHAKMCIDILKADNKYNILGILDNSKQKDVQVLGVPVLGKHNVANLRLLFELGVKNAINGIGAVTNHKSREILYDELKSTGFNVPNLIHKNSSVEPSVIMGEGNQIMANATVGSEVSIANNCIINSGVVLSHDSKVDNNVHLSPGSMIAGQVTIGKNTLIGMGTTVYLGANIGSNVIIYNGLNIMGNIESNTKVIESL